MKKIFVLCLLGLNSMLSLSAEDCIESSCGPCEPCMECSCPGPQTTQLGLTPNAGPDTCECLMWSLSADFLYWSSRESNLEYVTEYKSQETTDPFPPKAIDSTQRRTYQLDSTWRPGFRVGMGVNFGCDGWFLNGEYTWYRAHKHASRSVPPIPNAGENSVPGVRSLSSRWLHEDLIAADLFTSVEEIGARWDLHLNQIDLTLGRKFWLSRSMTMKPEFGLRAGWTRTGFDISSFNDNAAITQTMRQKYRRRYWGVGFLTGLTSTYEFTNCFALYGSADVALIWGKGSLNKKVAATNQLLAEPVQRMSWTVRNPGCPRLQAILDLDLGLSYTTCWCEDQSRFNVKLGWEYHQWFAHSDMRINTFDINIRDIGDLSMMGLVLKAEYGF